MDDYAESLHISTNWFIRNFKQYMKISPAQYILSLRMVNAQSLLENTEYNIGEIAEIVGYDNPLYFSRVFKKEYGVSPAQYRKNLEESTEKWERFLYQKDAAASGWEVAASFWYQRANDLSDRTALSKLDTFSLHFPVRQECASRPSGLNFP